MFILQAITLQVLLWCDVYTTTHAAIIGSHSLACPVQCSQMVQEETCNQTSMVRILRHRHAPRYDSNTAWNCQWFRYLITQFAE